MNENNEGVELQAVNEEQKVQTVDNPELDRAIVQSQQNAAFAKKFG